VSGFLFWFIFQIVTEPTSYVKTPAFFQDLKNITRTKQNRTVRTAGLTNKKQMKLGLTFLGPLYELPSR
jgi:hypothetical protein